MSRVTEELNDAGFDTYEATEEYKEAKKEINKSISRERTAERRLFNAKRIIRRRKSKEKSGFASLSDGAETS